MGSSELSKRIVSGLVLAALAIFLLGVPLALLVVGVFAISFMMLEIYKPITTASLEQQDQVGLLMSLFLLITLAGGSGIIALRFTQDGLVLTATLLVATAFADIGAYFTGKALGGPKLAPTISPKKTWSGLLGGWLWSAVVVYLGWLASDRSIDVVWFVALGATLAPISVGGDLLASRIKRHLDLDDFSALIPGHGGIADRLDSHVAVYSIWAWTLIFLSV